MLNEKFGTEELGNTMVMDEQHESVTINDEQFESATACVDESEHAIPVEEDSEDIIVLDADVYSEEWETTLEKVQDFFPPQEQSKDQTLIMVIPVPDLNETLYFYQDKHHHFKNQTLTTLKRQAQSEKFLDYSCLTSVLKKIGCFGSRLFPTINFRAALFPIGGSSQHTAFLNAAEIVEIKTVNSCTQITMQNGVCYQTTIGKRTITHHAVNALAILAAYRRDRLHEQLSGQRPLDYLDLPDTPFTRSICEHPLLQEFSLPVGLLEQQYNTELFMKNTQKTKRALQSGVMTYTTFSDLLK